MPSPTVVSVPVIKKKFFQCLRKAKNNLLFMTTVHSDTNGPCVMVAGLVSASISPDCMLGSIIIRGQKGE